MTYEEAVAIEHEITRMLVANVKEEHKDRVFTAHKTAIEALEKQIPQKPYKVGVRDYECPKCHKFLHVVGYPCRCGQCIDWRGEE